MTDWREEGKADSREVAKDAKKSVDGEHLRVFASSLEAEKADSREAARGAKKSVDGEDLRVFASPREVDVIAEPQQLNVEELSAVVVDCAYKLHAEVGPGLLESVYEAVLARMVEQRGVPVRRQVVVPVRLMGMQFEEGFRADLLVDGRLVVELKSVERLLPVHAKQLPTYLRLLNLPLGLLINFGAPTFKEGIKRVVNRHNDFASSRLRVNQVNLSGDRS